MSNFWNTSDGKAVEKTKEHESGSGFDLFPDGEKLLAIIDEVGWSTGYAEEGAAAPDVIKMRWTVLAPEKYKNRKVFQNIKVNDEKPTTADNAKRMLMAIDQNAGGKLSSLTSEPSDNDLMSALLNKTMVIRMGVWSMNGKEGNWVNAVSPRNGQAAAAAAPEAVSSGVPDLNADDPIPF